MMNATSRKAVAHPLPDLLPRLWRFGVFMCREAQTAQEPVRATCLRAMERLAQFAPGSRLDHWTFANLASILRQDTRK